MHYSPSQMHIPDGFLSITMAVLCWIVTIVFLVLAIKNTQKKLNERQIPLMGIMAAFIFAAQMINFPVAGGTSGHFIGGALAAIALGPWAGILVMTSVVGLQALLFQDGGLLVMGANILNMGIIPALIGYGLYRSVSEQKKGVWLTVSGVGAWLSVLAAALVASIQLWISGTSPARLVFPAMLGVHVLIGIGEALITVAALGFITQVRPDLIASDKSSKPFKWVWAGVGLAISLVVVLFSPLASAHPDGLERVAEDLGFLDLGQASPFNLLPDYIIPALGETSISTILAGIVGMIVVALIAYFIGRSLRRPKGEKP